MKQKKTYKKLYSESERQISFDDLGETENIFLQNNTLPKLDEDDKEDCDAPLTLEECGLALMGLANGKSPGSDGLPVDFYKCFWGDIKDVVHDSFKYSFDAGELSIDQRRGVIHIIPKKDKDPRHLKNWRPLTLLNADYKILAKALANRLQLVVSGLVSTDQTGYIKGRFIGDNIRTISDMIDYAQLNHKEGIIALLDFEKAFDSIKWTFLDKVLHSFNFGHQFQKWIRTLYHNFSCCVTNNGHASSFFSLQRGVRQGCPISPLLFVLVVEVLANRLRTDTNIQGIEIDDQEIKLTQLADDTTLFLKDELSLNRALETLDKFALVSGLKLNRTKTELLKLGRGQLRDQAKSRNSGIKYISEGFKSLGIWFSIGGNDSSKLNFVNCIDRIRTQINIWRQRNLSLKGKITILKALIVPQLVYVCSMLFVPDWFTAAVNKLFNDFLWDGKRAKVKNSTVIGEISKGGLKMPHVNSIIQSLKLNWLRRLLDPRCEGKWKSLSWRLINVSPVELSSKLLPKHLPPCATPFYQQIIDVWYDVYSVEPRNVGEVLKEKVWRNCRILVGGAPVCHGYKTWEDAGIERIENLVSKHNGKLLTLQEMRDKYQIEIETMKYNSVATAIPRQWKQLILESDKPIETEFHDNDSPYINARSKQIQFRQLKTRDFYWLLIEKAFQPPTAIDKWCAIYPQLQEIDWADVFELPYAVIRDTKYQTLQYKIINRIFPCKYTLAKWNVVDSELCSDCALPETLEHYFFECHQSYTFWNNLSTWLNNTMSINIPLTKFDVLFGIAQGNRDNFIFSLNYCIIIAKWYIYRSHMSGQNLFFIEFLRELKCKVEIENYLLSETGTDMSSDDTCNLHLLYNVLV